MEAEFDPPPLFVNVWEIVTMIIIQDMRFIFFKGFIKKWWVGSIRTDDLAHRKDWFAKSRAH